MLGPITVGCGVYRHRHASGREGAFLATGFAPLTLRPGLHIMPGYGDMTDLLDRLGKR